MLCNVFAVEVFTARDKLSGALSLAIDKLGGEDGAHGFFGSPVKRLQRYKIWVSIKPIWVELFSACISENLNFNYFCRF